MARIKGQEAIVEVDEEVQGRKRVNNEDARPAKRAKEEGSKAMKLPICFDTGRLILPSCTRLFKMEGEAAAPCDGEKTEVEEAVSDKVNRLRGLLADDPKKLTGKDMYDVIRYLNVDEIVSLALKSGEGEYLNVIIAGNNPDDSYVPSAVTVLAILKDMLRPIEEIKEFDVWLLYKNFPCLDFALLLLTALDSYSKRCFGGEPLLKVGERDMIPDLCCVLPWKLLAHVLSCKAQLPLLKPTIKEETNKKAEEEAEEECNPIIKKATKNCDICLGKGKHGGLHGDYCSFMRHVPIGAIVGPGYCVLCRGCHRELTNPVNMCFNCGSDVGGYAIFPCL